MKLKQAKMKALSIDEQIAKLKEERKRYQIYESIYQFVEKAKTKGMTKRDLKRHCRLVDELPDGYIDEVLANLVEEGLLSFDAFPSPSGRGKQREVYILGENNAK